MACGCNLDSALMREEKPQKKRTSTTRLRVEELDLLLTKATKASLVKSEEVRSKNPDCLRIRDFCQGTTKKIFLSDYTEGFEPM